MKRIFFLSVFLLPTQFLFSQSFKAGLFSGICASQVAGDNLSGFDKAGLIVGGLVNTPVAEKWKLQMEIMYIQKGSKKPISENESSFYIMKLNYAEVPVLVTWNFYKALSLEAGPSIGFLLSASEEDEHGIRESIPAFEKMDYSANIGIRFVYKEHWSFSFRFGQSFIPIRKNEEITYSYQYLISGQYNTILQNTFCYTF